MYDVIVSLVLVFMVCCVIGSLRGYDELVLYYVRLVFILLINV